MRLVACMADIMSMNIECMECEKEVSRMGNGRRVECDLCDDMRLKIEAPEGTMVTNVGIYEIRVSSDGNISVCTLADVIFGSLKEAFLFAERAESLNRDCDASEITREVEINAPN